MQKISVLVPNPFGVCTYFSSEKLKAGTFVSVPFGRQDIIGVVWNTPADTTFPDDRIKPIKHVLDIKPLTGETLEFLKWVAAYTLNPVGLVLLMMMIPDLEKQSKKPVVFDAPVLTQTGMHFSDEQQGAIDVLNKGFDGNHQTILIDGVTGSGKTEVYFEAISKALSMEKQVLVLLPEITLTGKWLERFYKRFGVYPACWHSNLTPKVRRDTWAAVASGDARVVVGARSALFLPFKELGFIVVDEEHDQSYKQEDGAVYQARDMAIVRAHIGKFPICLVSATPSLETYCNVQEGKFTCVPLSKRFFEVSMPDIDIVDMRLGKKGILSETLQIAIHENLSKKDQTLLFLNRRGYAPIRLCKVCGEKMKCPDCSVFLTEHKKKKTMMCHQCGYTHPIKEDCIACGEKGSMISCGMGVERVEEEVKAAFPAARTMVITSDTIISAKHFDELTTLVMNKEIDIVIGTQMLAKGHHFPDLTLVGILDADFSLSGGDLRAAERTFQLLQQVSGRAGREAKKGRAMIQTFTPENVVIQAMKKNDRSAFLSQEISARKMLSFPPFGRLAALVLSGKNEDRTYEAARALIKKAPFIPGVEFLGPVPAPIYLLRGKYRYRFLVKSSKRENLQRIIEKWLASVKLPVDISLKIDIDPYSFF